MVHVEETPGLASAIIETLKTTVDSLTIVVNMLVLKLDKETSTPQENEYERDERIRL